jgi:hypothetical protein
VLAEEAPIFASADTCTLQLAGGDAIKTGNTVEDPNEPLSATLARCEDGG